MPRSGCLAISSIGTPICSSDFKQCAPFGNRLLVLGEEQRERRDENNLGELRRLQLERAELDPAGRAFRGVSAEVTQHHQQQKDVQGVQIAGVALQQHFIVGVRQRDRRRDAQHDPDNLLADHVQRMQIQVQGAADRQHPGGADEQRRPKQYPVHLPPALLYNHGPL